MQRTAPTRPEEIRAASRMRSFLSFLPQISGRPATARACFCVLVLQLLRTSTTQTEPVRSRSDRLHVGFCIAYTSVHGNGSSRVAYHAGDACMPDRESIELAMSEYQQAAAAPAVKSIADVKVNNLTALDEVYTSLPDVSLPCSR